MGLWGRGRRGWNPHQVRRLKVVVEQEQEQEQEWSSASEGSVAKTLLVACVLVVADDLRSAWSGLEGPITTFKLLHVMRTPSWSSQLHSL